MIINILISKPLALPLAKSQTLICMFAKFRLRIKSILVFIANENFLYFSDLPFIRLQHRLQNTQLSSLTCLLAQEVSYSICKERGTINQSFNQIFFAGMFANNLN
ncbi:MAG: hypothetical protein MH472_00630 [Bacteroidia bacterium]|nr:hypothetical protein [Bacteroidia bacterium]